MKATLIKLLVVLGLFSSCKNNTKQVSDNTRTADSALIVEEKDEIIRQIKNELSKSAEDSLYVETVKETSDYEINSIMIREGSSPLAKRWNITPLNKVIIGDLNDDKQNDFIINGTLVAGVDYFIPVLFVFIRNNNRSVLYKIINDWEMAYTDTVNNKNPMAFGHFHLNRIENGMIIGNSEYHKGDEDFEQYCSYKCKEEKYRINFKTNELELVTKSSLVKEEN